LKPRPAGDEVYLSPFRALINKFNEIHDPVFFIIQNFLKDALAVGARREQLVRPRGPEFLQPLSGGLYGHVGEIVTQSSGAAAESIFPVSLHF
jgi:hypothetical protein